MREIKFRAWDTKKQIFVPSGDIIFSDYGDTRITVNPNCMEYIGDSCHNYNEDSRFKIMQYTGLKDKNEVEIYEGDIVKRNLRKYETIEKIFTITMLDLELLLKIKNSGGYGYEVIGNIYENKELLA